MLERLKKELSDLENYIPQTVNKDSLEEMKSELNQTSLELENVLNEKEKLDFISSSISGDNIKGFIISQELPFLNKFINCVIKHYSFICI